MPMAINEKLSQFGTSEVLISLSEAKISQINVTITKIRSNMRSFLGLDYKKVVLDFGIFFEI
tara:strand:- start:987 stop:1172 length:186 start_codon:yes stop_codon:yes gene_type:complete